MIKNIDQTMAAEQNLRKSQSGEYSWKTVSCREFPDALAFVLLRILSFALETETRYGKARYGQSQKPSLGKETLGWRQTVTYNYSYCTQHH